LIIGGVIAYVDLVFPSLNRRFAYPFFVSIYPKAPRPMNSRLQLLLLAIFSLVGCGVLKEKKSEGVPPFRIEQNDNKLSEEQAGELISEVGGNWLYGPGLGQTALNVGTMVVFPPYAIYIIGNSVLSLSGYEPFYVSELLPEEEKEDFNSVYDEITGAPGRVTAAIAGKEYRSKEVASERFKTIINSSEMPQGCAC
jgi:hypothetical protein